MRLYICRCGLLTLSTPLIGFISTASVHEPHQPKCGKNIDNLFRKVNFESTHFRSSIFFFNLQLYIFIPDWNPSLYKFHGSVDLPKFARLHRYPESRYRWLAQMLHGSVYIVLGVLLPPPATAANAIGVCHASVVPCHWYISYPRVTSSPLSASNSSILISKYKWLSSQVTQKYMISL